MREFTGMGQAGMYNIIISFIGVQPANDIESTVVFIIAGVMVVLAMAAVFSLFQTVRKFADRIFDND